MSLDKVVLTTLPKHHQGFSLLEDTLQVSFKCDVLVMRSKLTAVTDWLVSLSAMTKSLGIVAEDKTKCLLPIWSISRSVL